MKKTFLKILEISQENISVGVSFLIKLQTTLLTEHLRMTTSEPLFCRSLITQTLKDIIFHGH